MSNALAKSNSLQQDRELLDKAQEIAELFQRAVNLGYSITLSPEQMKVLVAICEEAYLVKKT